MEKSKTQNGGNTPKLSRKGTKKQTKIGSFVTNIFSRPKKHKENDKKSNEGEVSNDIFQIIACQIWWRNQYLTLIIHFNPIEIDLKSEWPSASKSRWR